jgi:hypothetical protein
VTVDSDRPVDLGDPHVIPPDEADQHATYGCPCGAQTEAATRPDGSVGWLTVHRRFDGKPLIGPWPIGRQ